MPGDPRECRQHAVRCLELARTVSSPLAKEKFVSLAATWMQLAVQLEMTLSLLESEQRTGAGLIDVPSYHSFPKRLPG